MLFSPALTDMASSLQQLVTGHLSSTVSEVILCVDKSGSSCLQVQAHLQHWHPSLTAMFCGVEEETRSSHKAKGEDNINHFLKMNKVEGHL